MNTKSHTSYLLQLQIIFVVLLGIIALALHTQYIIQALPILLSLALLVFVVGLISRLYRLLIHEPYFELDYVHGSTLEPHVYSPDVTRDVEPSFDGVD